MNTNCHRNSNSQRTFRFIGFQVPISCNVCHKSMRSRVDVQFHQAYLHRNVKKCYLCDRRFDRWSNLRNHLYKHSEMRHFVCDVCRLPFSTKFNVKLHYINEHKCEICNTSGGPAAAKVFANLEQLVAHKSETHMANKNNRCMHCDH
jgi:hypothetical protein